jgi:hypothetical protein
MNLDDTQRQRVAAWINEGLKLSEIQKRLGSELGLNLTYMEVRLLVDDLKLTPKDPEPVKVPADSALKPDAPPPAPQKPGAGLKPSSEPQKPDPGPGRVSVTVDHVTRPGALASGNVTFSDGKSANWHLDQTGRLGLVAKEQGYRPSAADVEEFQTALESELRRMGL